jgi:hypothetical protein
MYFIAGGCGTTGDIWMLELLIDEDTGIWNINIIISSQGSIVICAHRDITAKNYDQSKRGRPNYGTLERKMPASVRTLAGKHSGDGPNNWSYN